MLAIGIVVDDAIVVVENVERNLRAGHRAARGGAPDDGRGRRRRWSRSPWCWPPCSCRPPSSRGISGPVLPAVRGDHRGVDGDLRLRVAHPVAGARGVLLKPHGEHATARGVPDRAVPLPSCDGFNWAFDRLSQRLRRPDPAAGRASRVARAGRLWRAAGAHRLAVRQRRRPGFIPQQDQGYLITVVQLPPRRLAVAHRRGRAQRRGRSCAGDPGRRARRRRSPASTARPSPTRPTPAPSSSPLEPFEERVAAGLDDAIGRSSATLYQQPGRDPGRVRPRHPAAAGARHRQRRRLQDDRPGPPRARRRRAGSGGPATFAAAANQDAGPDRRLHPLQHAHAAALRRHRPRARPRCSACRSTTSSSALEIYLGSTYVNDFNYLGRTYRVTAQADAPFRRSVDDIAEAARCATSGARWCRSARVATFERHRPAPTACRATTSIRRPRCRAPRRPASRPAQAHRRDGAASRPSVLPDGLRLRMDRPRLQEKLAGNTALYVFAASACSSSSCVPRRPSTRAGCCRSRSS